MPDLNRSLLSEAENADTLGGLTDVTISGVSAGDFLKYNGSVWINEVIDLGTDTAGNYIATISGTANEINVSGSGSESATVTIGLPANVVIANNLTVTGDLTVSGNTTTINTANLNVEDNFILLNSGEAGTPSLNAGIEIERGTSTNVAIRWNETTDKWEFTTNGSTYTELGAGGATVSATAPSSPTAGSLWFDSDTGQTFVYYDSYWVEVGASAAARLTISATAPTSPVQGAMWFDSDDGATYAYYGSTWVEVGATAVDSLLNTIDAKGDILVGTADNTIDNLAVGTNGQLLFANSSTTTGLEWVTPTYATLASPTFTGTVVLPANTSIGNVSNTEISYIDGVTSSVQTQLDTKASTGKAIAMAIVFGG